MVTGDGSVCMFGVCVFGLLVVVTRLFIKWLSIIQDEMDDERSKR